MRRAAPLLLVLASCWNGSGSDYMKQPLVPDEERASLEYTRPQGPNVQRRSHTIGQPPQKEERDRTGGGGRVLGMWRNTYYDFPREADHTGDLVSLMNASCEPIGKVPKGFHDAVCVQGSGSLKRGGTVSFAKRDCACAELCPRTNQKICFDALDPAAFPWGRGASGKAIAPLRSVAADLSVVPMGAVLYISELDGVPRGEGPNDGASDGCFVVEDKGLKVQGQHVDIFTGHPSQTARLERTLPSNQGVTVVVDAPKCAHLAKR